MAERRMFAKSIVGTARFLKMPATSRLLYYDLGMDADDDGIVESFSVIRKTGATEDDLRVLVSKGFVRVLNEDLVTYISDWKTNNRIRSDRYHPSIHRELLLKIDSGIPNDTQVSTNGIPRLGEDSKGKESIGESGTAGPSKPAHFSPPTVEEVAEYCAHKGYTTINPSRFVSYYQAIGWKKGVAPITDWKAAVDSWHTEDANKKGSTGGRESGVDRLARLYKEEFGE